MRIEWKKEGRLEVWFEWGIAEKQLALELALRFLLEFMMIKGAVVR